MARMTMGEVREALERSAYALAYQAEMEAEYGEGPDSSPARNVSEALDDVVSAFGRLTTADDAASMAAAVQRVAVRAVHGN